MQALVRYKLAKQAEVAQFKEQAQVGTGRRNASFYDISLHYVCDA